METVIIRHILRTNSRDSKSISLIRIKSWTHNKFNSLIHNKITISITTTTTTLVTMLWVISQIKWVVLTFHRLQTNIHINLCTSLIINNSKCTMFHSSSTDSSSRTTLHIRSSSTTTTINSTILSLRSIKIKNSRNTTAMTKTKSIKKNKHSHSLALTAIDSRWKYPILKKKEYLKSTKIFSSKSPNKQD